MIVRTRTGSLTSVQFEEEITIIFLVASRKEYIKIYMMKHVSLSITFVHRLEIYDEHHIHSEFRQMALCNFPYQKQFEQYAPR